MKTAPDQLRAFIAEKYRTNRAFSEAVRISEVQVSRWVNGHVAPEYPTRLLIEAMSGIPATAWTAE